MAMTYFVSKILALPLETSFLVVDDRYKVVLFYF